MNRTARLLVTFTVAAAGCKAGEPASSEAAPVPLHRVEASLLVVPEDGAEPGYDPVQTQHDLLMSRTFREKLVERRPAASTASYRFERSGSSALLHLTVSHPDPQEALGACEDLLQLAVAEGGPHDQGRAAAADFLGDQSGVLEQRLAEAEQALAAFKKENHLMSQSAAGLQELVQSRLKDLSRVKARAADAKQRRAVDRQIEEANQELFRLSTLEISERRLVREVENAERMVDLVQTRRGEQALEASKPRGVRVLDPCAPAPVRGTRPPAQQ